MKSYDEKILKGWQEVAKTKLERTLTPIERKKFQRMILAGKISEMNSFYIGLSQNTEISYQNP